MTALIQKKKTQKVNFFSAITILTAIAKLIPVRPSVCPPRPDVYKNEQKGRKLHVKFSHFMKVLSHSFLKELIKEAGNGL